MALGKIHWTIQLWIRTVILPSRRVGMETVISPVSFQFIQMLIARIALVVLEE